MRQTDKLQFPQKVEILMASNVFIADTGLRVVSTVHIQILINKIKPEKVYSIILPDGDKTATEIIAVLRVTVCNNQGNRSIKFIL